MELFGRILGAAFLALSVIILIDTIMDSKDELMYLLTGKDEHLGYTEQDD